MLMQFEDNNEKQEVHSDNIQDAFKYLEKMHPFQFPYLIIQNEKGDYLQFAGGLNKMVGEVRFYNKGNFKHYVIGQLQKNYVLTSIECKIGPIHILLSEVLNNNDAHAILKIFFNEGHLAETYQLRNITKRFK